jgi:dihydrofolate reductase
MAKLIVIEFLTLDGVMEAPENWQFSFVNPEIMEVNQSQIHSLDALLLGRVTYEIFAAAWSQRTNNEFGMADKLNTMPKYVVSAKLKAAEWAGTTLINDNAGEAIRQLKQNTTGNIGVIGSANLVKLLAQERIIDEYQIQVYPTILGSGKRLFDAGFPSGKLQLQHSETFSTGVTLLTYHPAN